MLYALYLAVGKVDLEILMNEEIFFLQKFKKQLEEAGASHESEVASMWPSSLQIWPSQFLDEPIPIVGIFNTLVIFFAVVQFEHCYCYCD